MLIEKISEEELQFMEDWHYPPMLVDCLFSNFDSLAEFDDNLGSLRLYQLPMISYEPLIDTNIKDLNKKDRFKLRKNVGDLYNFGARKYGKTLCTEKLDIPISMLHDDGWWCGFSSIDGIHLRGVLDVIKSAIENHPILNMWKRNIKTAPYFEILAKNGWKLDGINMNLQSKSPGKQFYGKHIKKLWIEEDSFETQAVFEKRKDSYSELGAVLRLSGMTNFTKHSPSGKVFYDPRNKEQILNLPQYINPFWDEEEKEDRLKEFGGEDSINYRVFVKGEVVEDGVSEFDVERIQGCYIEKSKIKRFELKKNQFNNFQNLIVVDRPKNAERIFICADIGEQAGTEIIILSEIGDKYNYLYDIVLYNFTHDEQVEVFKWLIEKLEANIIGLDCGDGTGRAIYRELEKIYSKDNLLWYDGSMKINIGFEKDENKNIIVKKGEPLYRQELMKEWSIARLKVLLYEHRIRIPIDYKFADQINSVISVNSGTRKIYACVSQTGDHLFDAFRIFAIAQWLKKDFNQTPKLRTNWGIGVSNWIKDKDKKEQ